MNDSFVDFDLIGQVDPDNFKVTRPSFYSELIWDARKTRAKADGATIDWVVLRNRLQYVEARNMKRVSEAIDQLSKRVGFRVIPGLSERVIYRELFPSGLTMLDSKEFGGMGLSHVAARQELREMMAGLALPEAATAAVREQCRMIKILFALALMAAVWWVLKPKPKTLPDEAKARDILGVSADATPTTSAPRTAGCWAASTPTAADRPS